MVTPATRLEPLGLTTNSDSANSPPLTDNDGFSYNRMMEEVEDRPGSVPSPPIAVAGNPKKAHLRDPAKMVVAAGTNNPPTAVYNSKGQTPNMKFFDYNLHSMKKGVSSALLDVALLMANASQLKSVYLSGTDSDFYYMMMVMLIFSIILQVIVGIMLIWLSKININDANDKGHNIAEMINNLVVIGVFLLTVVNVFIAAIGISTPEKQRSSPNSTT